MTEHQHIFVRIPDYYCKYYISDVEFLLLYNYTVPL